MVVLVAGLVGVGPGGAALCLSRTGELQRGLEAPAGHHGAWHAGEFKKALLPPRTCGTT
jgi:hypothetical protein